MDMVFKRNEVISATNAAKNFGKVVSDLEAQKRQKTIVVKNNKITAVILSADDYEYMAGIVNFVEHLEIFDLITRRKKGKGAMIPLKDLLEEEGIEV